MPSKKDAHVSGNRSEGYRVTVNGKPVATAPTQAEAIDKGRDIARANQTELYVHRAQGSGRGQIRERDTEGPNDPFPPPG